jgi:hypothetical protein
LAADAADQTRIRFVPNTNWNGTTTITFRAWDQSDSASNASLVSIPPNGTPPSDTSAYSFDSATAQLTVTPVNDLPSASSTSTNWTTPLQEDNFAGSGHGLSGNHPDELAAGAGRYRRSG